MKGPIEVLQDCVGRLEKMNIDYFLVGSLAAMVYSRPRYTNDIDLVVQVSSSQAKLFAAAFPIQDYYCPPIEILFDEISNQGSFNLINQASGIKIDVVVHKKTEFYKSEMLRRRQVDLIPGFSVFVASPEDIILKKLDFFREGGSAKHLDDIRQILAFTVVDRGYLDKWIVQLGLNIEWGQI
jgi:hypothetical protein